MTLETPLPDDQKQNPLTQQKGIRAHHEYRARTLAGLHRVVRPDAGVTGDEFAVDHHRAGHVVDRLSFRQRLGHTPEHLRTGKAITRQASRGEQAAGQRPDQERATLRHEFFNF